MSDSPHWSLGKLFEKIPVHQHHAVIVAGPIDPWSTDHHKVRCLFVGGRDHLTVAFLMERSVQVPITEFVRTVLCELEAGHIETSSLSEIQSTTHWSRTGDSIPAAVRRYAREQEEMIEADDALVLVLAQALLNVAVDSAIDEYLDSDFCSVLRARPLLPLHTASQLTRFGMVRGAGSMRFIQQALLSESIGLLNVAAKEISEGKASLADVIASGNSLPEMLLRVYEIPAWIHRATQQLDALRTTNIPGDVFIALTQATARVRRHSLSQKEAEILILVAEFVQKEFRDHCLKQVPWDQLLKVTLSGRIPASEALARYHQTFEEIETRLMTLDSCTLPARSTIFGWILALPVERMGEHDGRMAIVADSVLHFSKALREQHAFALDHHPGVPRVLQDTTEYLPLVDAESIVRVGRRLGNCLASSVVALQYTARGLALYLLTRGHDVEGVCALGFSHNGEEIVVLEVEARREEKLTTTFHCAAWQLALACSNDPEILVAFTNYHEASQNLFQISSLAGISSREDSDPWN